MELEQSLFSPGVHLGRFRRCQGGDRFPVRGRPTRTVSAVPPDLFGLRRARQMRSALSFQQLCGTLTYTLTYTQTYGMGSFTPNHQVNHFQVSEGGSL